MISKHKVFDSLLWMFGERIAAQLISTIITIVLARLLTPEHYGIVSIVMVVINFLNIFVTSGFGTALVQKEKADSLDFDTCFIMSFIISLVLYFFLFVLAPIIADFYNAPELIAILRVMGIRLPLASVNSIQHAFIQREMKFKKFFLTTICGTVFSGIVGVVLAYNGFGVWALVFQYIINTSISTILLSIVSDWRPKLQFSSSRARAIWSFGWKLLLSQLVANFEGDVRSLIVGKVFGATDLAYYDQGKKYPALLVVNINASIDKVMLPAYAQSQNNMSALLSMLRRSLKMGLYILSPILLGFLMISDSFVRVVLTDKWVEAIPFIKVFCLVYLTRPIESSCRQALLAIGKSNITLICMIIINVTALLGVLVSVFLIKSVFAIAITSLINTFISLALFLIYSKTYIGYKFSYQFKDAFSALALSFVMCFGIYIASNFINNGLTGMILKIFVGAVIYVAGSKLLKLESYEYLMGYLQSKVCRKKRNT